MTHTVCELLAGNVEISRKSCTWGKEDGAKASNPRRPEVCHDAGRLGIDPDDGGLHSRDGMKDLCRQAERPEAIFATGDVHVGRTDGGTSTQ
jgi:hypothetical protein